MNEFQSYQKSLNNTAKHKIKRSNHIIDKESFEDFCGFSEYQIWGEFCDFDYDNWLKEQ